MLMFSAALVVVAGAGGCVAGRAEETQAIPPALVAELEEIRLATSEGYEAYVVQPKDTLWAISQRFGTSVEAVCRANDISASDPIKVGQRLLIPVRGTGGVAEVPWASGGVSDAGFVWPVRGRVVGRFGQVVGGVAYRGVDIEASPGEDVVAVVGGKVVFVSEAFRGLGKVVVVSSGGGVQALHGKLGSIAVGVGEVVRGGEPIGKAGYGVGTRVHLRIFDGSELKDPMDYLP